MKQQSTTKPSLFKNPKAKPATKPVDDDETFCETLEKANQASIFDDDETFCETPEAVKRKSSGWLSKPQVKEKEAKKIDNGQKGKKPDAPPVRRSLHETSLFAFQLPPARVPSAEPEKEEAQPAKEEPDVKVKQEKLADPESEDLFAGIESFAADMDCESSKGSSVVFVEPDVNLAITIDDPTVQSDDHLKELEANFVNQLYEDSPVKVLTPPRKRTRIYGECADCREVRIERKLPRIVLQLKSFSSTTITPSATVRVPPTSTSTNVPSDAKASSTGRSKRSRHCPMRIHSSIARPSIRHRKGSGTSASQQRSTTPIARKAACS